MNHTNKLLKIIGQKKPLTVGLTASALFFIFYLLSIQHISVNQEDSFSFSVVDDWADKLTKIRAPFQWEPIAVFNIFGIGFFISLNIVLGFLLAALVFFNISVAIFSYSLRRVCSIESDKKSIGLVGILPSMFTGFACCAPTFIIALAPVLASFTLFFIQIQSFLIPASISIMLIGLYWSLSRITEAHFRIVELKVRK